MWIFTNVDVLLTLTVMTTLAAPSTRCTDPEQTYVEAVTTSSGRLQTKDKRIAYKSMADELYRMWATIEAYTYNRQRSAALMAEYKEQLDKANARAQKCAFELERGQREVAKWTERAKKAHLNLRDKHQAMEEAEIVESCMSSLMLSANLNVYTKDNELRLKESNRRLAEQGLAGFLKNYTHSKHV